MKKIPDILAAALTVAIFPADSDAAKTAKADLTAISTADSAEKAQTQDKFWEYVSKEAIAVIDMVGACPTYLLPVLRFLPIAGTVANWMLLSNTLIPQANKEIAEDGEIAPGTAISIIGAGIGLIPTGSWIAAGLKLAAGYIGLAPDSLPAAWAANILNFSPDAAEYAFNVISDIDIFAKYIDDEKKAAYSKILGELRLEDAVSRAIAKDLNAQRLLTYNDEHFSGMTGAIDRPPEYWGERAQFLALKLKGDITGTYDGFPKYGQAGIYEGFIGSEEVSGYVGVVTPGIGDTIQFGTQGYTAGSLIADDKYWGTSGDDRYSGLGGSDTIYGFEGNDTMRGDAGDDKILGGTGDDTLLGGMGSDTLKGEGDNDVLNGGLGTDYLYGGAGDDWLGYDGADVTQGSGIERDSDGNYYEGGAGTDHVFGSVNADRIRFNQGDGTDIVTGNGGADILEYVADGTFLTASREGKSLVLSRTLANGTVDRIVLQNWYADIPADSMRLDRVDFGAIDPATGLFVSKGSLSGDILHEQGLHKQIRATAQELRGDLTYYQETLQGSIRSDWLYSSQVADENSVGDILVGEQGDDYLYGSIGADKVRIGAGDGKDVFRGNGGADIVETYNGLTITNLRTSIDKVGTDLRITFVDGTQLTIRDWDAEGALMAFREGTEGSAVGSDWVNQHIKNFYGNAADNFLFGNEQANQIYGYKGDDFIDGGTGADIIKGGEDNDTLYTSGEYAVLDGEAGTDSLYDFGAHNTLQGGDGSDILGLYGSASTGDGGSNNDVFYVGGDSNTARGGADADSINNFGTNSTLIGGRGEDTISDFAGGATILWTPGDSQDSLLQAGAGTSVQFGRVSSDYTITAFRYADSDLVLQSSTGGGVVIANWFNGANQVDVELADGSFWTSEEIAAQFRPPTYTITYPNAPVMRFEDAFDVFMTYCRPLSDFVVPGDNRWNYDTREENLRMMLEQHGNPKVDSAGLWYESCTNSFTYQGATTNATIATAYGVHQGSYWVKGSVDMSWDRWVDESGQEYVAITHVNNSITIEGSWMEPPDYWHPSEWRQKSENFDYSAITGSAMRTNMQLDPGVSQVVLGSTLGQASVAAIGAPTVATYSTNDGPVHDGIVGLIGVSAPVSDGYSMV